VALTLCFLIITAGLSRAETVDVKYRGPVDLAPFKCDAIDRSGFIHHVCYDQKNTYMIVKLDETYDHYCDIDKATVDAFMAADPMGRYYNANIKGHFECRMGHVPNY
jgi:KTSC domain